MRLDGAPRAATPAQALAAGGGGVCGLVSSRRGPIYLAHRNGRVERYTPAGRLEWATVAAGGGGVAAADAAAAAQLAPLPAGQSLTSLAAVGDRVWVGTLTGALCVLCADTGRALRVWHAHRAAIIALSPCVDRVYSLAADGSLSCWCRWRPSSTSIRWCCCRCSSSLRA